jgi:DNA polymerase-3 subunit delta'
MLLSEIKGHDATIRILEGARSRGRIASSYLFAGEDGIGKKTCALAFAASLNCKEPVEDKGFLSACGHCPSCIKIDSGTHPDVLVVEPLTNDILICQIRPGKDRDKCDQEGYDKPRVEEMLAYRSFEGGMKVVIVDQAEKMNVNASNAFLKTLEEPPEGSIIFLISSKPDRLLPTIRSRCSRLNFRPLSDEACREAIEAISGDAELPDAAVSLAMGRPGIAATENLLGERDSFLDTLDLMLGGESKPPWKDRPDTERFLDQSMLLLRDMAVVKTGGSKPLNSDMTSELKEMGARSTLKSILKCYDGLCKLRATLFFNLNRGITWNYAASLLGELKIHG